MANPTGINQYTKGGVERNYVASKIKKFRSAGMSNKEARDIGHSLISSTPRPRPSNYANGAIPTKAAFTPRPNATPFSKKK